MTFRIDSGRQSLVTPIDWKLLRNCPLGLRCPCRQSLVTPIDWKLHGLLGGGEWVPSRQSLVTPIDWKPVGDEVPVLPVDPGSPILGDAY